MSGKRPGWTRYERCLLDHSTAGAELARRGRDVRESASVDPAVAMVITGVIAPLAISFDAWVRRRARERGIGRLYYLARNARIPFDVARARQRLVDDVDLRYLAVSRDLVRGASLAAVGVDRWFAAGTATPSSFLLQSLEGQDPSAVIRRLGLDPVEDGDLIRRHCGAAVNGTPMDSRRVIRAMQQGPLLAVVRQRAAEQLELVEQYFETEGLDTAHDVGMVDIGWQGQQAAMIEAVLSRVRPTPALHLHLGGYHPQTPVHPVTIEHWLFEDSPPSWLASPVPLFETLFPSIGPAAQALERTPAGDVSVLVRDRPEGDNPMDLAIQELTAKVAAAVDPVVIDAEEHDLAPLALELARRFWMRPSAAEAVAWGRRRFERDGSGQMLAELATPIAAADLGGVVRRDASVKRVWPEGAIAASALPLRLALTPLRRSAQSLRRGLRTISRRG